MLKLGSIFLILLSLIAENTKTCKHEKITLIGTARNSLGTATVLSDDDRLYLLDKIEKWDSNIVSKKIMVTKQSITQARTLTHPTQ